MFVEKSGLGPIDGVRIEVDATGAVEVVTGGASVGQGFETAMAQICADALGVDYRSVRVVHGQTDRIEYGIGAHASRATVMTGAATHMAAAEGAREGARRWPPQLLQTPADALDIVDGEIVRKDGRRALRSRSDIARCAAHARRAATAGLAAEGWFYTDHMTYPYGVACRGRAASTATPAASTVERYLVAYDVGRAVNPMLVEGQIVGGFAQGLGGALSEEFLYDESGEPLSVTFADYLMPTAREVPAVDVLLTEDAPSPLNPLGLKGAGEGGINRRRRRHRLGDRRRDRRPGAVTQLPVTPHG